MTARMTLDGKTHVMNLLFRLAFAMVAIALGLRADAYDEWTVYPDVKVPLKNGDPVEGISAMPGPDQMTNVLHVMTSGDKIIVTPGTYDFTGIAMQIDGAVTNHLCAGDKGLTIVGNTSGHWDDSVVFRGNGRCVLADKWKAAKISNVTFEGFDAGFSADGGAVCFLNNEVNKALSNCVFRSCRAKSGGAARGGSVIDCLFTNCVSTSHGGALFSMQSVSECRFTHNRSGESGGAVYNTATAVGSAFQENVSELDGGAVFVMNSTVSNCEFRSNIAMQHGGALSCGWEKSVNVYGCDFEANVVSNGVGGAVLLGKSSGGAIRKCTFTANMTVSNDRQNTRWQGGAISSGRDYGNIAYPAIDVYDCTFTGNFGGDAGGAVANGNCSNCVFRSNRALRWGAGICRGSATDCTFIDNIRDDPRGIDTYYHIEYGGNDAYGARLLRCDMDGGCYSECSIEECRIHDVTNSRSACVFWGRNWVTNCLVTSTSAAGLSRGMFFRYHDRPAETSVVVNCTFADNELGTNGMFGRYEPPLSTNNYLFLNSIFYNNTFEGMEADLRGPNIASGPVYSNCLFGASSCDAMVGWKDAGGNMLGVDPVFAGEEWAVQLEVDPYSLRWSSPAIGKGDARCFAAGSPDLAGKMRLRGGVLDLGCFQCYMPRVGMVILVR